MSNNSNWQFLNGSIFKSEKRASFTVDGNCLIVEDRKYRFAPDNNERILRLAGSGVFYSVVPLDPSRHKLLCYEYCDEALKMRPKTFYHQALVLGCGGGAIPRWLLEEYPDITVDVVDRSAKMIEVCRQYFLYQWDDSERLHYHCIDALEYEQPEGSCQFLFCDLFGGTELAPFVYTPDFAARLHGMLSPNGILVVNCGWGHLEEIQKIYRAEFPHFEVLHRKAWQTEVVRASDGPLL